jgi:hypothetical protein
MAPSNKAVMFRALTQKTADKLGKFADRNLPFHKSRSMTKLNT